MTDLGSSGFGFTWNHTRAYSNRLHGDLTTPFGDSWMLPSASFIRFNAGATGTDAVVVIGGSNSLWFEPDGSGGWRALFGARVRLVAEPSGDHALVYPSGVKRIYYGQSHVLSGRLRQLVNRYGTVTDIGYDSVGRLHTIGWNDGTQSAGFTYQYFGAATPASQTDRLQSVTRSLDGNEVARALYDYHPGTDGFGSVGDLRSAIIEEKSSGLWAETRRYYHRYWTADDAGGPGFRHGLKYVVGSQAYATMLAAGKDPLTVADNVLAAYADYYFEYNGARRVTLEKLRGGTQEFAFSYLTASPDPGFAATNTWYRRTVETRPDGTERTVYTNRSGQALFSKLKDLATDDTWFRGYQYDSGNRLLLAATPAAIDASTVSEPSGAGNSLAWSLKADTGLVQAYTYYSTDNPVAGSAAGRVQHFAVQRGANASSASVLRKVFYGQHVVGDFMTQPVVQVTVYPVAGMPDATAPTWRYHYSYYGGGSAGETGPYEDVEDNPNNDPSADTVYEQFETTYDDGGNGILGTAYQRFHDAVGTGPLGGPNANTRPRGRRTFSAAWPDGAGRVRVSADYGTHGGTVSSARTSPPSATMARRS